MQTGILHKINMGLIGLFILMSICIASSLQAETMTAEHLAKLQYVSSFAISPDGQHIAYTKVVQRNPFSEDNGKANLHLYVTDLEGNSRPYIIGTVRITNLDWSPDGTYIYYTAERDDKDKNNELYRIALAGGESEMVIDFKTEIKSFCLSPDGTKLSFLAKDSLSTEIDDLKDMGFNQEIYEEDWQQVRIWTINLADDPVNPQRFDIEGSASEISYSPDGSMIAMAIAPTPLIDDNYMARKVAVLDITAGKITRKFGGRESKLSQIKWSPDCKTLAIIAGHNIHDPREGEVYLLDIASGIITPLLTDLNGHVRKIDWLSDTKILYLMDRNVHTLLATINIDGSGNKVLLEPGRPVYLYMNLSADRKSLVLAGSSVDHPRELFYYKIDGKNPERLTYSNPWLANIEMGRQEVVNFKARDGLDLQGILIYPVGYVQGERYPMIMYVHGGPEAHERDDWLNWCSAPGQVAAGQGYAVFYPNYRGSTGRGVEFSMLDQAGYAEGEFDDLVDAVDHLVNIGLVDRSKVGITGGSYGGFATAWASTALSEHFAAGVMSVGVSDLISKFGTTDIPNEMFLVHARSYPWERWQWFLEQSPIYHAQNCRTPLLIAHGDDDTRVHPSQSMELYRYIKTIGKTPVRLVFYPGEGHGNIKAAARYDYSLRMMRWFNHYLKGPGGEPPPSEIDHSKLKPEKN